MEHEGEAHNCGSKGLGARGGLGTGLWVCELGRVSLVATLLAAIVYLVGKLCHDVLSPYFIRRNTTHDKLDANIELIGLSYTSDRKRYFS